MFLKLIAPVALVICFAQYVSACTCIDQDSPCSAFQGTPVVFVGLVKSIDEQMVDVNRFGRIDKVRVSLTAHFVIEESLKNIRGNEVTVITGGGGGDCGYYFKTGERYLVYAYRTSGEALNSNISRTVVTGVERPQVSGNAVTTSICSRTQPLSRAKDDLDLIHALLKGYPITRIFGTVDEYVSKLGDFERDAQYKPKAGFTIQASGSNGNLEAQTNADGHFSISGLRPGVYKLHLVLPPTYGMQYSFEKTEFDLQVTPGCWGAQTNFTVAVNGRIRGHIYNSQGKPVGEQVRISLVTLASADNALGSIESRDEYTGKEGQYEFYGVPPGRYILGINIAAVPDNNTPYPRMYHPDSLDRDRAVIINFSEGQKLENYDVHLPAPLITQTVTGTVYLKNGKPAAKATVEVYDLEWPERGVWGAGGETDAQGRFTIKGWKGRRYKVRAYLSEDYLAGVGAQSEMIVIDTDVPTPLKIVLTKNGIFRDQK